MRTHSLESVAEQLGLADEMKNPVVWLQRRIRRGDASARKFGHHWRMTDQDVADLLESLKNQTNVRELHHTGGLSAASLRRRAS